MRLCPPGYIVIYVTTEEACGEIEAVFRENPLMNGHVVHHKPRDA